MPRIYDLYNNKTIAEYYSEAVSNSIPYLGETLFPPKKKLGLDLKYIKSSKGVPQVLKLSAFDTKATLRDRAGFTDVESEMPFFKESMLIKERDRQELNKLIDSGNQAYVDVILNTLLHCKYSRIPVFEDSVDNIVGILYIKDLTSYLIKQDLSNINFKDILHSPCFIPETKQIDELFLLLKQSKNHMSILIDEYGGFSGIVTMEDIIEEIVGDIEDEYDKDNDKVKNLDNGEFEIKGNMSLLDFNNIFDTDIKCDDCDTINGYIISIINKIPTNEEDIILNIENYQLKVMDVDDNRIEKVKVTLLKENVS